jgi:hypothetical protein
MKQVPVITRVPDSLPVRVPDSENIRKSDQYYKRHRAGVFSEAIVLPYRLYVVFCLIENVTAWPCREVIFASYVQNFRFPHDVNPMTQFAGVECFWKSYL